MLLPAMGLLLAAAGVIGVLKMNVVGGHAGRRSSGLWVDPSPCGAQVDETREELPRTTPVIEPPVGPGSPSLAPPAADRAAPRWWRLLRQCLLAALLVLVSFVWWGGRHGIGLSDPGGGCLLSKGLATGLAFGLGLAILPAGGLWLWARLLARMGILVSSFVLFFVYLIGSILLYSLVASLPVERLLDLAGASSSSQPLDAPLLNLAMLLGLMAWLADLFAVWRLWDRTYSRMARRVVGGAKALDNPS
ncbi:MAG: hypothetical protein AB1634_03735 [Thermodesulfobacteriota bacterium]